MAYITKEQVKEMRVELKRLFPAKEGWKLSVTNQNLSTIKVAIMQAPIDLATENGKVNYRWIEGKPNADIFKKITDVCMNGNYNNSDSMRDYFDVGWYFDLSIGKWDKPFVFKAPKVKTHKTYEFKNLETAKYFAKKLGTKVAA